ncbi:MAG: hypothetical protein H6876_06205 [Hyphomicrobiaceae bacterium]|nr:hypothetical protein [Hyphomicrobiaceae bacterium]
MAEEPSFDVPSQSLKLAAGLPGGLPIDLAGFHTGMTQQEALAKLTELAGTHNAQVQRWTGRLPYAKQNFLAAARLGFDDDDGQTTVLLTLTSNASGNQVFSINRDIYYKAGAEPGTDAYVQAIRDKYGEPSLIEQRNQELYLRYRFIDGRIAPGQKDQSICHPLQTAADGHARYLDPNVILANAWHHVKQNDSSKERCSAYLFIQLRFVHSNNLTNPKAVADASFGFADGERMSFSVQRDSEITTLLNQKAKDAAVVQGTGTPKL